MELQVYDKQKCSNKYSNARQTILPTQICAGGEKDKDSCQGDSGGPLMHYVNSYWELVGIVSYGRKCGLEDWPGIYTLVSAYETWIKSTLRG